MPFLGGREHPVQLLHLRIRDPEHDGKTALGSRGDLRGLRTGARRAQHLDVTQDDPREPVRLSSVVELHAERGDEVDLVTRLERAGEQLVPSPGIAIARCTPVSWALTPLSDGDAERRVDTCSPA